MATRCHSPPEMSTPSTGDFPKGYLHPGAAGQAADQARRARKLVYLGGFLPRKRCRVTICYIGRNPGKRPNEAAQFRAVTSRRSRPFTQMQPDSAG